MGDNARMFSNKEDAKAFAKKIGGIVIKINNESVPYDIGLKSTYRETGWWAYKPVDSIY